MIAVAVGATLRLVVLATKWNQSLLLNDSLYYSSQAWQNAQGRWFRDFLGGHPGAEHAPLTSLVLTPSSLLPRHQFWQRATNTLIGIVTVALIGRLGWRVAGRRVGVVAAFIAALYPNLWMNDALIMAETVSTLTAVIALWFAVRHAERLSLTSALLCGLAVGLATLARSELLLLAPLFALIGLRREPWNWVQLRRWASQALVVVAAAVALLVPWTLYNLSRFDAPVLLSTNAGGALHGANCPDTYYGPSIGGWSLLCLIEEDRPGEDVSERSQRWQDQAVTYVENNTRRIPVVVGARLLRAADLYDLADLVRADAGEERMRWASWAGIVT
ncbi:MAG: glycosyltransferase family 39 protein, partial [Ilumatobacteraceae bacterium]